MFNKAFAEIWSGLSILIKLDFILAQFDQETIYLGWITGGDAAAAPSTGLCCLHLIV